MDNPPPIQDSAMLKGLSETTRCRWSLSRFSCTTPCPVQAGFGSEREVVLQRLQAASAQFEQPLKASMVLDLRKPAETPTPALDPTSPFVTPGTPALLPVESTTPAPKPSIEPSSPPMEPD
jgi:hypothetical protein